MKPVNKEEILRQLREVLSHEKTVSEIWGQISLWLAQANNDDINWFNATLKAAR